jgi:broad specificity phosphatase PhoE
VIARRSGHAPAPAADPRAERIPSSSSSQPEGRLALVRHARSSHVHTGWIDAAGFRRWRQAYEAAGIRAEERVPPDLGLLAARADLVLASDAPRAIASARLLAPAREIVVSPLLRELDLESAPLGGIRLPLAAWALAVGARNLLLTLRRQYPSAAEAARVDEAVTWLAALAAEHPLVVAVTHASFRRQVSTRLLRSGWRQGRGQRSLEHWSAWLFTSPVA